jgi:hypothetical protein
MATINGKPPLERSPAKGACRRFGDGLLGELIEPRSLRAERAARACVAVVVPIERGGGRAARRLVGRGRLRRELLA